MTAPGPMRSPAGSCADSYLDAVIPRLWPAPLEVTIGRRRRPDPPLRSRSFLVVPSTRRPKLIVPDHPRLVSAAAVRNYNTGSGGVKQRLGRVLALAARLGLAQLMLRNRLSVLQIASDPGRDIEAHLSEVLGASVQISLYIGPARAVRKPILQVLDRHGRTSAFAKLGIDEFTRALVRAEGTAVDGLARETFRTLVIPEILHRGSWNGDELLVQRAMPRGKVAGPERAEIGRAADELARTVRGETAALADSAYWSRLRHRTDALAVGPLPAQLRASMDELQRDHGRVVLDFGASHGDWAPWNMTVLGSHVHVWDWEKFATGLPIGFDTAHFVVQHAVAVSGMAPHEAFAALLRSAQSQLSAHELDEMSAVICVWIYALDISVRYLEDRETSMGTTPMTRMSEWLPATLGRARTRAREIRSP